MKIENHLNYSQVWILDKIQSILLLLSHTESLSFTTEYVTKKELSLVNWYKFWFITWSLSYIFCAFGETNY